MEMQTEPLHLYLDSQTQGALAALAGREKTSPQKVAEGLILRALEAYEDELWAKLGDKRLAETTKWLSHGEVWAKYGL